ncbi:Fic family protein [bacterium]|nr:Fic family protein [bacterium]
MSWNYDKVEKLNRASAVMELSHKIDSLAHDIATLSTNKENIWTTIHQKLRYLWTYNTNAIEGSTLTEGETIFFLKEGLTVEGKPFKDFIDAKNHHEAIEYLYEVIKGERPISEGLIKELNALLLLGITVTKAIDINGQQMEKPAAPGEYKQQPNHVLQANGAIHYYVEPLLVIDEMGALIKWIEENSKKLSPLIVSTVAHYNFVRIHPFDDGNGRGARLLMNLILIKEGFPPAIIKNEKRRHYINALVEADKGDLEPFSVFVGNSLVETMQMVVDELRRP